MLLLSLNHKLQQIVIISKTPHMPCHKKQGLRLTQKLQQCTNCPAKYEIIWRDCTAK